MLLLNPGYTKTVNLAANQTLYVETLGLAVVTVVSGLGITAGVLASVDGSQTFGPYAEDGVLTIAATKSDCTYGVSDADNLARVITNPDTGGPALVGPDGTTYPLSTLPMYTPAQGYELAVRASQNGYQNLIDQSPAANVLTPTVGLFPAAWVANGVVALNAYKSPSVLNGILYKCTTAGTNGATEPTWGTTIGGTTTSGTAVYTAEKGPYFVDASGIKLFRSIASSQIGTPGTFILPGSSSNQWNMAAGQSLIINLRPKFNWATSGQAATVPIFSNRNTGAANVGINISATGSTFNDLRVGMRDASGNSILTGQFSASAPRKPMDGTERNVTVMVDGVQKMMYFFIDGVAAQQADMFDGANLCPNAFNLAALTGSTVGENWTIGGHSSNATTYECAFKQIDMVVLPGGLPANIQNIAAWFARGSEALLPQSLVI